MAYTIEITKQPVKKQTDVDMIITINVVIKEDGSEILNNNYSERYNSTVSVDSVKSKLLAKINNDWQNYKAEQAIFSAAAFDNMIADMISISTTVLNS